MADFTLKQGNTRPVFTATVAENPGLPTEKVIDLTEATKVYLIMRLADTVGTAAAPKIEAEMEVVEAAKGTIRYKWQPTDTDTPGTYDLEVEVQWKDGGKQTFPPKEYSSVAILPSLRAGTGTTGQVLTLNEYKRLRKITGADEQSDEQLELALEIAGDIIVEYTRRQFTLEPTVETRKYRYEGQGVLDIEDCRNVTSVVLYNRTLTADFDYHTGPEHGDTTFWIDFAWHGLWPSYSAGQMGFTSNLDRLFAWGPEGAPFIFVEVTAEFGWPRERIPASIKQAAAWLVDEIAVKRPQPQSGGVGPVSAESIADLSYSYQIEAAAVTAEIPPRIRAMLDPYSRPEL